MSRAKLFTGAGIVAVFFAVVLNLATGTDASANRTLAIASAVAAIVALAAGIWMVRRGGSWRFYAIALIGPGIFVLADAGVRTFLLFRT